MTPRPAGALPGVWGLTSAVPVLTGAAEAASGELLREIAAALAEVWRADVGPLGLTRACPTCGSADHGAPRLTGLPEGRPALVSFSHVSDAAGRRVRVGAWWTRTPASGTGLEGQEEEWPAGLGLDLARVDAPAFVTADGLGDVAYSAAERAWIAARPPAERPLARARLWTRKEALVKAAGTGFTGDPADVDALSPPPGVVLRDVATPTLPAGLVGSLALALAPTGPTLP